MGRRYYYYGNLVAEVNGGGIFEGPVINITEKGNNLKLAPIKIEKVTKNNKKALFILENEAMDFIQDVYKKYKSKIDFFSVAFSGGKDSQIVLDLVSRILHPEDYIVIFSDTTMEIPYTYEAVKDAKNFYSKKYPTLKFYTANPPKPAIEFWKDFGPPSRFHRWCCTVTKTAPFEKLIKEEIASSNRSKLPRVLVFDGVRAEESSKRKNYSRLAAAAKHIHQTNAEVIRDWNSSEVFLYIFWRRLYLNKGYRFGLNRIGCSICPFASGWSDYILSNVFSEVIRPYVSIIQKHIKLLGIKKESEIKKYLVEGQWKKRAGGEGVDSNGTSVNFLHDNSALRVVLKNPRENFLEWVKVLGKTWYKSNKKSTVGDIKFGEKVYHFEAKEKTNSQAFSVENVKEDAIFENKIKKIFYKSAYCVHCGACEVECPTGALQTIPKVKVNTELCVHCGNCLNFVDKGCLVAKSIATREGGYKMENNKFAGFGRYSTFGMRSEWLEQFFEGLSSWFVNNNLGNKQEESMKAWLRDSELMNKNEITDLAKSLSKIRIVDYKFVLEVILVNLYYHSSPLRWYLDRISWGDSLRLNDLYERVKNDTETISQRTVESGILSLVNLLEKNPIGKELRIGIVEKVKNQRTIRKYGTDEINPLAIAYAIYKTSEDLKRYNFTVSEFYSKEFKGGPYKIFGISRERFEKILRGLQEDKYNLLRIDLKADLDNIHLLREIKPLEIVKISERNSENKVK